MLEPGLPSRRDKGVPPGCPHATPIFRKAIPQERVLLGCCRTPTSAAPARKEKGQWDPAARPNDEKLGQPRTQAPGQPPPPPTQDKQSKGLEQEMRRGTNHTEKRYQRPPRAPGNVQAQNSTGGAKNGSTMGARVHNHITNTQRMKRAAGLSSRNIQSIWNGVPAGKDRGHPDGAIYQTHREGRKRGTARGGGGMRSGTALPP